MRICCQIVDFDPDVWKESVRIHGVFSRSSYSKRSGHAEIAVLSTYTLGATIRQAPRGAAMAVPPAQRNIARTLGTKCHASGGGSGLIAAL